MGTLKSRRALKAWSNDRSAVWGELLDDLEQHLRRCVACLREIGADFAMVGGLAVGIRTQPRFTMDIDLALAVADDDEAERILSSLLQDGFRPVMELDHAPTGRLATMRLAPPGIRFVDMEEEQPPIVDLLFCACGIEDKVVSEAAAFAVYEDLSLPVAQIPHLIAMKTLSYSSRRMRDLGDLQALIQAATPEQLTYAAQLVSLMIQRGHDDGRDLSRELAEHVETMRLK